MRTTQPSMCIPCQLPERHTPARARGPRMPNTSIILNRTRPFSCLFIIVFLNDLVPPSNTPRNLRASPAFSSHIAIVTAFVVHTLFLSPVCHSLPQFINSLTPLLSLHRGYLQLLLISTAVLGGRARSHPLPIAARLPCTYPTV